MSNSARTIKMVRKCRLTNMITKKELASQRHSRIFQIREQLAQELKDDPDSLKVKI